VSAWIAVADRLPDAEGVVLGALVDDNEPVWLVYHDGAGWVSAEGSPVNVSHWMDLPAPPTAQLVP
jgi:hypothetical protein